MNLASDLRIPVTFGGAVGARDAVLVEGDSKLPAGTYGRHFLVPAPGGHIAGCACCAPRGAAAAALGEMFRARATGAAPFFSQVVVRASAAGEAEVRAALEQDIFAAARFRLTTS